MNKKDKKKIANKLSKIRKEIDQIESLLNTFDDKSSNPNVQNNCIDSNRNNNVHVYKRRRPIRTSNAINNMLNEKYK